MSEKFGKTKLGDFVIRHKLLAGMMYFIGWYLSGVLSQALYKSHLLMRAPDKADNYEVSFGLRSLVQWCTNFPTGLITLIVFMAVISWVIIRFIAPRMRVEVGTKEKERNVIKSDNDTYGTAALGTTEEFEDVTQIGKIEDCKGIILGQDKESNEVITLPTAGDSVSAPNEYIYVDNANYPIPNGFHDFKGWTKNKETNELVEFEDGKERVTEDTVYYAVFE